jgi:hypothetical protein
MAVTPLYIAQQKQEQQERNCASGKQVASQKPYVYQMSINTEEQNILTYRTFTWLCNSKFRRW